VIVRNVVVVGDVMLDVVVKPDTEIAPTSDTPSRVRLSRGGAAANVAEALARARHHVTYVGACGDDLTAQLFESALRNAGVEVALERLDSTSGVVVALVDGDGQRAMMTDRGANSRLGRDHVLRQLDRPFDHLHVSGYTLLDPLTTDVGRSALARAHELGRSTSIDVCSVAPLIEMTPAVFLKAARGAHTLFANEEEALTLSGASDVDAAIERLAKDFNEVVITQGPSGARARSEGVGYEVSSASDVVVDTTGAGDAATGAYMAMRLGGGTIEQALETAMSAASLVVRGLGSRGQSRI
jgi:sugar/nucleoside kinase (ribokinase family)